MSIHYASIQDTYSQLPVIVAVGPPNTGKTLLATAALATMGLEESIVKSSTPAYMAKTLSQALTFLFNDPQTGVKDDLAACKMALTAVSLTFSPL